MKKITGKSEEVTPSNNESLDETLEKLAQLNPLEYDQVRKTEAKRLNVQLKTLDEIVSRLRPSGMLVIGKQEPRPASVSRLVECKPRTGIFRKLDC